MTLPERTLLLRFNQHWTTHRSSMDTEYYSMRLVSEAKNFEFSEWPIEVQTVTLSANDQALSADEKIDLAQKMVCDNTYQSMLRRK